MVVQLTRQVYLFRRYLGLIYSRVFNWQCTARAILSRRCTIQRTNPQWGPYYLIFSNIPLLLSTSQHHASSEDHIPLSPYHYKMEAIKLQRKYPQL